MPKEYTVGVEPGTRLYSARRCSYDGDIGWQMWISLHNPRKSPSDWYGTFLFFADSGRVVRVTIDQEDLERVMEIKNAD